MPTPKATPKAPMVEEEKETVEEAVSPPLRLDETIPGGHYYTADGVLVNCWNQPIDEDGNILDEMPLLRG
jgi:hypothetical protein